MSSYSDRERELIEEGYDSDQAIEIAAEEKGRDKFYEDMKNNNSDDDD